MEDTTQCGFGWCAVIKTARNMFSEWISESMLNRKLFSRCRALLDTGQCVKKGRYKINEMWLSMVAKWLYAKAENLFV